jgi:hypothetical protein
MGETFMIRILKCASLVVLPVAMLAAGVSVQAHGIKHHHRQGHHHHGHHGKHAYKGGKLRNECVPTPANDCRNNGPQPR